VNTHYTSRAHPEAELETPRRPRALATWVAVGLVTVWVVLMSRFGSSDVYSVMGPYACVVTGVCIALSPRGLLAALSCDARGVLLGLSVGAVMTLLTYPAFLIAVRVMPSLHAQVSGLYQFASTTSLEKALLWIVTLVIAEEVLFREVLPNALQLWTAERSAFALAVLLYSLAQLGSGSWIIFLLALVCGATWTALRLYTGSITPSLLAHGIWTPTVIVLIPVTQ
jgi:membrane protease YdiL (CAAX protease family)